MIALRLPQAPDLHGQYRPTQSRNTGGSSLGFGRREGRRSGMRQHGRGRAALSGARMTTGSGGGTVAHGQARHIPVLARQVANWLGLKSGGLYIDGTFGAGGYTGLILRTPGARVIGLDRDAHAIAAGASLAEESGGGRLTLIEDRFSNLAAHTEEATADGVVFDLGLSSMQIDEAERGFSFRLDGPLDMRM